MAQEMPLGGSIHRLSSEDRAARVCVIIRDGTPSGYCRGSATSVCFDERSKSCLILMFYMQAQCTDLPIQTNQRAPNLFGDRPLPAESIAKTPPSKGALSRCSALMVNRADVTNSVAWSIPPKVQLVGQEHGRSR
jgi:hypothetical protein